METLIALLSTWGKPNLRNWLTREPTGEWEGVSTGTNGRIWALNLIGSRGSPLGGRELPPELGNLTSLRELNPSGNSFGGEIPAELGNLARLKTLLLANDFLTECLPAGPRGLRDVPENDLVYLPDC